MSEHNKHKWLKDGLSKDELSEVQFGLILQSIGLIFLFSALSNVFIVFGVIIITIIQYQRWTEMQQQKSKYKKHFYEETETEQFGTRPAGGRKS